MIGDGSSSTTGMEADEEELEEQRTHDDDTPAPIDIEPCSLIQISDHIAQLETELQEIINLKTTEIEQAKSRLEYLKTQNSSKRKSTARKRKICFMDGCTSVAKWKGVCQRHGASIRVPRCSHDGCNNQAQKGGICVRHGAKRKVCSFEGCMLSVAQNGVCIRHGAKLPTCSNEGCTNRVQNSGLCYRHGATKRVCSHDECNNWARKGGVCKRHGSNI